MIRKRARPPLLVISASTSTSWRKRNVVCQPIDLRIVSVITLCSRKGKERYRAFSDAWLVLATFPSLSTLRDSLILQVLQGDLGAIDAKYDVAVSTAASAALDYLLVDTKETIEVCLRALKQDNVGRATFLALDRMEQQFRSKCASVPKT